MHRLMARTLVPLLRSFALICLLALVIAPPPIRAGAAGADLFTFQCAPGAITFFLQGTAIFQASFTQIYGPLAAAISLQKNQPIIMSNPASLWALMSNELQVHLNDNPDGTKLILASSVCGQIYSPDGTPGQGQALAIAQVTGPGEALAYARVTASGQAQALAAAAGAAQALAYAQASGAALPPGQRVHIVQPGENLFRISLRYGTTVSVLVRLNNIRNPDRIYVGQILRLP